MPTSAFTGHGARTPKATSLATRRTHRTYFFQRLREETGSSGALRITLRNPLAERTIPMEITTRSLWTMIHGMGFGALYLMACSGALVELHRRYGSPMKAIEIEDERFLGR